MTETMIFKPGKKDRIALVPPALLKKRHALLELATRYVSPKLTREEHASHFEGDCFGLLADGLIQPSWLNVFFRDYTPTLSAAEQDAFFALTIAIQNPECLQRIVPSENDGFNFSSQLSTKDSGKEPLPAKISAPKAVSPKKNFHRNFRSASSGKNYQPPQILTPEERLQQLATVIFQKTIEESIDSENRISIEELDLAMQNKLPGSFCTYTRATKVIALFEENGTARKMLATHVLEKGVRIIRFG